MFKQHVRGRKHINSSVLISLVALAAGLVACSPASGPETFPEVIEAEVVDYTGGNNDVTAILLDSNYEPHEVGTGELGADGALTLSLVAPPTEALFGPEDLKQKFGEDGVTVSNEDALMATVTAVVVGSQDDNIGDIYLASKAGLRGGHGPSAQAGDVIGTLFYADRTFEWTADADMGTVTLSGTVKLNEGWNLVTQTVTAVEGEVVAVQFGTDSIDSLNWYFYDPYVNEPPF